MVNRLTFPMLANGFHGFGICQEFYRLCDGLHLLHGNKHGHRFRSFNTFFRSPCRIDEGGLGKGWRTFLAAVEHSDEHVHRSLPCQFVVLVHA